jgi:arginine decarboxylase
MTTPIIIALGQWTDIDHAPFYTPGHKHGWGMGAEFTDLWQTAGLKNDLPELPGLDNLAAPSGVIEESQNLAAHTFGANHTRYLVNGSSCGVMAAILATCQPGDQILLPRNVHRSIIAGLIHSGAVPIFLQPEYVPELDIAHGLAPELIELALIQYPHIKAIMVVAPTYYGVCGDLLAIAAIAHQHGIPLLVDAAHGAHFGFHPDLPPSALTLGADLVIQSVHKTLGALTQASMLHVRGDLIDIDRVDRCLQLLQTSSPSYLLLASLDSVQAQMATYGRELLDHTLALTEKARSELNNIPGLLTLDFSRTQPGCRYFDTTRLTITTTDLGYTGYTADEVLCNQYRVVAEMPSQRHLTFIISIGNREWDIEMLVAGVRGLAQQATEPLEIPAIDWQPAQVSTPAITPRAAFFAPAEIVPITAAINHIATELVCPYPPGIPLLIPGELVTEQSIEYLQNILQSGGEIVGNSDPTLQYLRVVKRSQLQSDTLAN